ncbi:MAG: efflux RND transporter periplasmic adaptor subunit [Gammaproteobacteria bacterium]|nr:efflux RND transporter periplasmic adaptor subunit [Gammaproteobacteria bacterium]
MKQAFSKPLLAIVIFGLLNANGLLADEQKKSDTDLRLNNAVLTVNTIKPEKKNWPLFRSATGGLYPWQDAVIAAETGGLRVTQLLVEVGSEVKRGQKLAQLSQDIVKVDVSQKEALVAQAKAELAEAKANAKRAAEAKGGNAFSEQQITQYLIAQDKAQANLANAEAQLQNQKIRLEQTKIVAVDDGVISSRSATLGAVVQTGTELFRLVRKNRLEWRAELMADQLADIHAGQTVNLQLTSGEVVKGKVRVVAPTFNENTRKALVYVDIENSDTARAGMFARGNILLGEKNALTVPESAVVLRDGYAYLFTVDKESRVTQHKVETGRRADNKVEIVSGIDAGALIVASGGAFLNSGDTVRIAETNAANSGEQIQ